MIDALESLNLTQKSQWNAKEMSWDERGCFDLAQYAHKYVKCPRVRVKSRPTHIYRHTPSNRAVELTAWATDASDTPPTDAVPASVAHDCATCPRASKCNGHAASVADHPALKWSYLLAPNSDFDDLGHFGKLTQRATQPTKAFDPIRNG
jgi:hypothetical protein